jgi:cell wall-associated NlpC family hydrolase
MTVTVSRVLAARPEALIDVAGRLTSSAAAAGADIAAERAGLVTLVGNWGGSAATAAQLHGAELLAGQERYRAKLLALQQVLTSGGATLSDIRTQLAALVDGDLGVFWQIGDDGSAAPGLLLQEYAALSPVTELQVTLMAFGLEREIRQLLAEFALADMRTAENLHSFANDAPTAFFPAAARESPQPNTVPGPYAADTRYQTGQRPTLAGSPEDSPRMHVASGSSDHVRLQDNPPGFTGSSGPARDAAWQAYLSQRNAVTPGAVTPQTVLPHPDAVSDPGLKTVGAAAKQQGVSYAWGGGHLPGTPGVSRGWRNDSADSSWTFNDQNRTGFDCSGLARFAAAEGFGFDINATNIGNTVGQEAWLTTAGGPGTVIPDSVLTPGDLIYLGPPGASHHVVVYAGNGMVVQAQGSGEPVEVSPIDLGGEHRNIRLAT